MLILMSSLSFGLIAFYFGFYFSWPHAAGGGEVRAT